MVPLFPEYFGLLDETSKGKHLAAQLVHLPATSWTLGVRGTFNTDTLPSHVTGTLHWRENRLFISGCIIEKVTLWDHMPLNLEVLHCKPEGSLERLQYHFI